MTIHHFRSLLTGGVGLAALLVAAPAIWTQEAASPPPPAEPNAAPPGLEELARGPVHEAFAEPAHGQPKAAPVVAKQPPDPIEEVPPDQKPDAEGVQWLPGYWGFDEEKQNYLWVSGFWRVPPPGRQWVPGHWNGVEGGWQWVAGFWTVPQASQEVTYLPPPPDPIEAGPSVPAPTADHIYVSGGWVWRDTRYIWRPGYWYAPRAGWVWTPAHYSWTPCGYVFVEGYWDYTLRDRGILFAPVYVDVAVCRRPGWYYTPRVVVATDCMTTAMFVRPGYSCYYFGDYYEPCHRQAGFVAIVDVRVGGCRDPIFAYARYEHRADPRWEVSFTAVYAGRYSGEVARPPRTFVQQTTIVNNVTNVTNVTNVNNTTINNTNINNVKNVQNNSMVTTLNQVQKNNTIKLKQVAPEEKQQHAVAAKQMVQASAQRTQLETEARSRGVPTKPTDAPRVMKMDLPKPPAAAPSAVRAPVTGSLNPAHPAATTTTATGTHPAANVSAPPAHPGAPGTATPAAKTVPPPPSHATPPPPGPGNPAATTGAQPHVVPSAGKTGQDKKTPPPHPAPADTKHSGKSDDKKDKDKDKHN